MDALQGEVECIMAREVLQWSNCGRPFNIFTHPTPSEEARPAKPTFFGGSGPKLSLSILVKNSNSSLSYVVIGILKAHG